MSELRTQVGKRIRYFREAHGLTQVELAQAVGISEPTLVNIERGKANTTLQAIEDIAHQLDITPSALFAEEVQAALAPQKSLPPILARLAALDDDEIVALTPMFESILEGALSMRASDKIRREKN